jgi:DNA polymerase-3 subunit epsilon
MPEPTTDLRELELLVVDCQTTGASPQYGHLLELGWATFRAADSVPDADDERLAARLVALPEETRLPGRVADITGITAEMLADADAPDEVWRDFAREMREVEHLAAHYAQFEQRFLEAARETHGDPDTLPSVLCTHAVAERLYPGLPRRGLRALAGFIGRPVDEPNRAGSHVRATAAIWRHVVDELRERLGVTTLDDLRDWLEGPVDHDPEADGPTYAVDRDRRLALPDRPGVYRLVGPDDNALYVGKATSLKSRVNQYFQTRKGLAERKLELVSQVHDVEIRPTATPLEAALLEADHIKEVSPPYNRSLVGEGRDVGLVDPGRYGAEAPDLAGTEVPVRHPEGGERLQHVADAFEALDVTEMLEPRLDPEEADWRAAVETFRETHELQDRPAPERLYRLGLQFWPPPDRDDDEEPTVVEHLESLVRGGAARLRRGIWMARLAGGALAWQPDGWEGESAAWRFVGLEGCEVAEVATVADAAEARARVDGWNGGGGACASIADYDRLRVLTTEMRRLVRDGRPLRLRLGRGTSFERESLERALELV